MRVEAIVEVLSRILETAPKAELLKPAEASFVKKEHGRDLLPNRL